ncbi:hypothetical protein Tco_0797973, partial [Tanacetum coccineum]
QVFIVNLHHDGIFIPSPLRYVQGDLKQITDIDFEGMSFNVFRDIIKHLVHGIVYRVGYENKWFVDLYVEYFDYDVMDFINEEANRVLSDGSSDEYYSSDEIEEFDDIDFHTEGEENVVIKNLTTHDPFSNKLCGNNGMFRDYLDESVPKTEGEALDDPDDAHIDPIHKAQKGMRYEHPEQLKQALANYGVANGYQLWYARNDWRSLLVYCGMSVEGESSKSAPKSSKKGAKSTKSAGKFAKSAGKSTKSTSKSVKSGADNRLPMLEKDMYDSWKSRMELYTLVILVKVNQSICGGRGAMGAKSGGRGQMGAESGGIGQMGAESGGRGQIGAGSGGRGGMGSGIGDVGTDSGGRGGRSGGRATMGGARGRRGGARGRRGSGRGGRRVGGRGSTSGLKLMDEDDIRQIKLNRHDSAVTYSICSLLRQRVMEYPSEVPYERGLPDSYWKAGTTFSKYVPTHIAGGHETSDSQKDRAAVRARFEVLRRKRLAYEQESMETRQALARSEAYCRALSKAKIAPKRAIRSTPVTTTPAPTTTTTTTVTNAQLQAMIDQGVTATLAARDATRNGIDSHTSGTGVRGSERVAQECSY